MVANTRAYYVAGCSFAGALQGCLEALGNTVATLVLLICIDCPAYLHRL